jgi:hypothetical protein
MVLLMRRMFVYRACLIFISILSLSKAVIGCVNLRSEEDQLAAIVSGLFGGDVVSFTLSLVAAGIVKETCLESEAKFIAGIGVVCLIVSTVSFSLVWSGADVEVDKIRNTISVFQLIQLFQLLQLIKMIFGVRYIFRQEALLRSQGSQDEELVPLRPRQLLDMQNQQVKK